MVMQMRPVIFVFSAVLLVPFVYSLSLIPDACALPPAPGFTTSGDCKSENLGPGKGIKETCCWTEPGTGTGLIKLREKYCQSCTTTPGADGKTTCDQKEIQVIGKPPAPEAGSGILQDPSTDSGPKLLQKDGMIFKFENNTASPEVNSTR